MLDEILKIAKSEFGGKLSGLGLNQEQLDKSVNITGETVKDGLKEEVQKNNLDGIMALFSGKDTVDANNPIVNKISSNAIQNITSKLGISSSIASTLVNTIVPFMLSKISGKLGGGSENILSGLSGLLGGGLNLGSLGDIAKKGMGDKLKDLF